MFRSSYLLDANLFSPNRVKARIYLTRSVEEGGNILLVQGQLSIPQLQLFERVLRAGAAAEGLALRTAGRYYEQPRLAASMAFRAAHPARRKARRRAGASARSEHPRRFEDRQPRAPGLTSPVISPNDPVDDDVDALAAQHVKRILQRR